MNTVFLSKGEYISNNIKIYKHYLKNNLFKDVITIIGILHFGSSWISILILIKIIDIYTIIESSIKLKLGKFNTLSKFLRLGLYYFLAIHWFSCFWYKIGTDTEISWLT